MTYLVLDLETVPDASRWSPPADKPDAFGPPWSHRIVCAASLVLTKDYETFDYGLVAHTGEERELLADLSRHIAKLKPMSIVTFNGRKFDLPVIAHRALLHGIQIPWFYKNADVRIRYKESGHLDLCDALSDYGACSMSSLDDLCKLIGLPGKVDVSGADVARLHSEGRHAEIVRYCLADVAQTALLLLRFRLIQGDLRRADYELARDGMLARFASDVRLANVFGNVAIPRRPIGTPDEGDSPSAGTVPAAGASSKTEAA